jgi:benzoyl-CoA reductase/2-hydroxyglutaryl-CoA dehydratase subunit BcrC/BadD/HgdB
MMTLKTEQIRTLNDQLRQNLSTGVGTAVITTGVAALGDEAVARIVKTIAVYDDFCHENDPYEEHDFGAFEADGAAIFFKIDYYDRTLIYRSDDPADPSITHRVITIMLAEEY